MAIDDRAHPSLTNEVTMKGSQMKTRTLAIVFLTVAWVAGCATPSQQQPSGRMEDVSEARATITAIDRGNRLVTVQDQSGKEVIAEVPVGVANLDEVQVGDQVVVSYSMALAWKVRPAGQDSAAFSADAMASHSKPGDKVASSVGKSATMSGKITAIDLEQGTVTLAWEDGTSDTIKARDPANLKKVKVGDVVDILYSEALAVALRPAAK
jgi:Cu/Ag efflux protein CusF